MTRFREEQRLPWPLRFITMATEVDDRCLRVRVGVPLPPLDRNVPLERARAVKVHDRLADEIPGALGRYWLIGVRGVPGRAWAYTAGSRRGVSVEFDGRPRIVIGSEEPERLADAICAAAAKCSPWSAAALRR